jgi:hypothetical protein
MATTIIAGVMIACTLLYFVGCSACQEVVSKDASAGEHLIVGTMEGGYFRAVPWTVDSLCNFSGRGAECSTLAEAKDSRSGGTSKRIVSADRIATHQMDLPDPTRLCCRLSELFLWGCGGLALLVLARPLIENMMDPMDRCRLLNKLHKKTRDVEAKDEESNFGGREKPAEKDRREKKAVSHNA